MVRVHYEAPIRLALEGRFVTQKILKQTRQAMEKSWDQSLGDFFDKVRELSKKGKIPPQEEIRINTAVYDMSEKVRDLIHGQEPL